jgi:hypothetical protein
VWKQPHSGSADIGHKQKYTLAPYERIGIAYAKITGRTISLTLVPESRKMGKRCFAAPTETDVIAGQDAE